MTPWDCRRRIDLFVGAAGAVPRDREELIRGYLAAARPWYHRFHVARYGQEDSVLVAQVAP